MSFVHLHVHTEYSLLDGFSNIKKLIARAKELNMPAVAITDHGTMFGVVDFFTQARAQGVKPIIGLETYVAARSMRDRDSKLDKHSNHLLLLAENQTGYLNLLKIASAAQLEGFYYYPRIDHEFLAAHSEGLIATSGCLSAEIPEAATERGPEAAYKLLDWYYDLFGPERFFIELQRHDIPELVKANEFLLGLRGRYPVRYIATNDVHYIRREDSRLQDILLSIQTGSLITDPNRFRMSVDTFYLRSPEEMAELFADVPEALSNTLEIAERCNVDLSTKGYHLPIFEVPDGFTPQTYLRMLCEEGLQRRYGPRANDPVVRERLEYELGVIHQMGFDTYFLIVWDLCRHAREVGIWYNARGSAAGSMTAYTLDITLVEPISLDLIFERFLNPGRISMPDIDLDFQDDLRPRIMEYCAQRYGEDKVAQIITFGTMGAKGAIRDVGRVMDIPLAEVDRVTKMISAVPNKTVTIKDALEQSAELKAVYDDPQTAYLHELIDTAARMEGAVRNAGTHAAGVVITDQPIINYAPLHRPTSGSEDSPIKSVLQFEMSIVEALGLLKVDFLGLATLTIMSRACQLIENRHHIQLNLNNIPIDDPQTFDFIGSGRTAGVFQLEGTGMTRYILQMKPRNLSNVIAMVALYRPGPLEFIPQYIRRMHGEEPVEYRHPSLEPIFKETFGIPVYQEQIMRAAVDLAGYTLSESDELRKAIAKKMKDKLMKHREKFIVGAEQRGIPAEISAGIFDDWEEFARYGFNKSHAADYGVIAVQTAYLKAHYTVEYMTALLSASKNETEKVALYSADSRSMGIDVLPPDVNSSGWDFTIEDRPETKPAIRFGLGAIKNVGLASVELIIQAREEGGRFADINDFARRVDLRAVGKRALEYLIRAGALDTFGSRQALLDTMDRILLVSTSHFKAMQSGQMSFFSMDIGMQDEIVLPENVLENRREWLEWERELIGLYVSDHPLSPYLPQLRRKITRFAPQLGDMPNKAKVVVGGLITRFRQIQTQKGKPMGFATIEDSQGEIELVLFPRTWEQYGKLVQADVVVVADGTVDNATGDPKILVDRLRVEELQAPSTPVEDVPYLMAAEEYLPPPSDDDFPSAADRFSSLVSNMDFSPAQREAALVPETLVSELPARQAPVAPVKAPAPEAVKQPEAMRQPEPVKQARPAERPGTQVKKASSPDESPELDDWEPVPLDVLASWADGFVEEADDLPPPKPAKKLAATSEKKLAAAPVGTPPGVTIAEPQQAYQAVAERGAPAAAVVPAATVVPAASIMPAIASEPETLRRVEPVPALEPAVMTMPFLVSPSSLGEKMGENAPQPRMVTVIFRSLGNKGRDIRRMRRVHGLLVSFPGPDRFSFLIFEGKYSCLLDFPNNTTGMTPELMEQLVALVSAENVRVDAIKIQ